MAKKRAGKTKSAHIRDYLSEHPDASPQEITDALGKRGIRFSVGLASNIKYSSGPGTKPTTKRKPKKRAAKKKAAPVSAPQPAASGLTVDDLLEAKKLVDELGSVEEVRKALDALEKLTN